MGFDAVPMTLRDANEFVSKHHRHNKKVVGHRFSIGCIKDGELVGVAIVGRPVARKLDDGTTAEVTRVCVFDNAPMGACSFLYSRCWQAWRAMGGTRIVTYTLASEAGSSVRGAGWKVVAECRPQKNPWKGPDRDRDFQEVYGQMKLRWEMA